MEAEQQAETRTPRRVGGIPLRAFVPNAVTAMALCCGLSAVRAAFEATRAESAVGTGYAQIAAAWGLAVLLIVGAGVLDGVDGRIARLLKANTRFGAELDSLSDVIAFGVAPATILYLWSLTDAPKFGWTVALSLTVCCALRLARFNANIDMAEQPHKSAGFNTGVPAPAGAGLALLPMYLWLVTDMALFRQWWLVMPWILFVAVLMIANVATFNWSSLRPRREWRLFAIAGLGLFAAAAVTVPFQTLIGICILYLALIPFSIASYMKVRTARRRAAANAAVPG
jgi:CDP-diacylglycerol---serine O-phosphatidyltransferase